MKLNRGGVIGPAIMAACIGIATTPAIAADFGGPRYAEPPMEMPFSSIWQGLYGGVHLGYGDAGHTDGVVGGGQLGYNWQANRFVYGLEGDISVTDTSVDWLASVRGRAGILLDDRLLAYGTAGVGFADIHDDTETDFVYGLGLESKLTEAMTARLEYLNYNDIDVDVIRAGLNFKFGY
ncbi:MAG TPA: outer membrane beta-barrel protein [Hyphomicrobiaceae bacterium]|jgi:outer membrane immunogenic protein